MFCSLPTLSDGDSDATLCPCDREEPELCVKHSKSLHRLGLWCRTHHGRQLPGTACINLTYCVQKLLHVSTGSFLQGLQVDHLTAEEETHSHKLQASMHSGFL